MLTDYLEFIGTFAFGAVFGFIVAYVRFGGGKKND